MYLAFMLLHLCPGIYLLCMLLSTFMMIYRQEHIYYIYIYLSYLCFHLALAFFSPCLMSSMLLYFYMIHIAFVSWLWCFPVYEKYIPFTLWESVALALNAHEIHKGIYFLYTFLALYMIHCTNYVPAFI